MGGTLDFSARYSISYKYSNLEEVIDPKDEEDENEGQGISMR